MLLLLLLLGGTYALREQSLLHLEASAMDDSLPDDPFTVGSSCTQSSDWTGPGVSACQRPCRFAEPVTYVSYKVTTEGVCKDQRAIKECPVQPPFCDNAADCVTPWGAWSACDASCGGGLQSRTRTITQDCLLSCFECATDWRTCNSDPCGYDCVLDEEWGAWSACSVSCVAGDASPFAATRHRYKHVVQGVSPGQLCTPDQYAQTQVCSDVGPCPVNCVLSPWGLWTQCNVQCGCGHQSRSRTIVTAPSSNGVQCDQLTQTQNCLCDPCPRDCELSEWSFGPCMGDCYNVVSGVKIFPSRTKTRYVIQEQIPYQGGCATPCQLSTTQFCTWLPPCDSTCILTDWTAWSGNCSGCVAYGSVIPSQERFRSITSYGDGLCGCTKEIRVCDLNWCCEDCKVGPWSAWGACIGYTCSGGVSSAQGIQRRERHVLSPGNPCGAKCPTLVDTQPCRTCCPIDCQVSEWILDTSCGRPGPTGALIEVTCGPDPGIRRYHRSLVPGNECGAPCPGGLNTTIQYKDVTCYPKLPCCPVDCVLSEWTVSDCFGCGVLSVAWKSREIVTTPGCGGKTCCDIDCAKFVQVRCPKPTPCPQTPCVYGPFGDWDNCPASCHAVGSSPNKRCRHAPLIEGPPDCPTEQTDCEECNGQCCPVNCEVGPWGAWGKCSASCGHGLQSRTRPITTPQGCSGAPCPLLQDFESCQMPDCPVDCVISEWSFWTLCPSCGTGNITERYRTILRQGSGGGASCPTERHQQHDCPNLPCDRDCTVGPWSAWSGCSVLFGDGFKSRTRIVVQTKIGQGMDCPPLLDTEWCYNPPPKTCIVGPPIDEPCPVTCQVAGAPIPNHIRHRGGLPLTVADTGATLETCPDMDELIPCILPCCPVDCVVDAWGPWSECIDGVKNRTRSVISQPTCGGAACPTCYLEKDDCPYVPPTNECDRGEACEDGFTTMTADV